MLNHTIPFMVWMPYKKSSISTLSIQSSISDYIGDEYCYIFNTNNNKILNIEKK